MSSATKVIPVPRKPSIEAVGQGPDEWDMKDPGNQLSTGQNTQQLLDRR
jgi:hypothetical protein